MDDRQAQEQARQMIQFILGEAKQQAAEITSKCNEDFEAEKSKMVQGGKDKLRTDLAAQKKKNETARAIDKSNAINKSRLQKIGARQQCLEQLTYDVSYMLADVSKSEAKYKSVMADLMVQGALKLVEKEISVRCREADKKLAQGCLDTASSSFAKLTGMKIKFTLSSKTLPANSLGGCILATADDSIVVDNTLDTRLKLCMEGVKPELRMMLFKM